MSLCSEFMKRTRASPFLRPWAFKQSATPPLIHTQNQRNTEMQHLKTSFYQLARYDDTSALTFHINLFFPTSENPDVTFGWICLWGLTEFCITLLMCAKGSFLSACSMSLWVCVSVLHWAVISLGNVEAFEEASDVLIRRLPWQPTSSDDRLAVHSFCLTAGNSVHLQTHR